MPRVQMWLRTRGERVCRGVSVVSWDEMLAGRSMLPAIRWLLVLYHVGGRRELAAHCLGMPPSWLAARQGSAGFAGWWWAVAGHLQGHGPKGRGESGAALGDMRPSGALCRA